MNKGEKVIGWCKFSVEGQAVEYRKVIQTPTYQYTVEATLEEIADLPEVPAY